MNTTMNLSPKKIIVLKKQEGLRLDVFLSQQGFTRSQALMMIKKSFVKKFSKSVALKPSHLVKEGEVFQILIPPETEPLSSSHYPSVPIVFEDDYLLVINKPAPLVVHPAHGHQQDTLVDALRSKKITLSPGVQDDRPGVVHRLDKDVSGLMILAKSLEAQSLLIKQFKEKKVHRIYRALVVGSFEEGEAVIRSFIGRHPRDRKRFCSFQREEKGSKLAVTFCRVLESWKKVIHHLECRLETGRTHQIRIHVADKGLSLIGDPVYSSMKKWNRHPDVKNLKTDMIHLNRIALYSASLRFIHPITKTPLQFHEPWPEALETLLDKLDFCKA